MSRFRIGIDLGGTKIAGAIFTERGETADAVRIAAPRDDYAATLQALVQIVGRLETSAGEARVPIGLGMPGSLSPRTGLVQNANSTWLNGRAFGRDLTAVFGARVRLANDANCFALSEAVDGAGAGARRVLGVILGTGCGSGFVVDGRIMDGPRGIGGEWGHNPLPWMRDGEWPGPTCWCGRRGCMETWVSGPGMAADHHRCTGETLTAIDIAAKAAAGDAAAAATLDRHAERLARGLASVVNVLDPDVILLGGGLSHLPHLYALLGDRMAPHIFADDPRVEVRPPTWGDAGGVRGAAWLWPTATSDRPNTVE